MAGASLQDLANEIVNATRVITDAPPTRAGQPVHVSVIPGFSPTVGSISNLANTLTGGTLGSLTGTITGTLAVDKVDISISYSVLNGNVPAQPSDFARTPPVPPSGSDVLDVAFLLKPPIGENTQFTPAADFHIVVTIQATVEGFVAMRTIDIPVRVPALQIPAIAVLGRHSMTGTDINHFAVPAYDGDSPNWLLVMVRAGSPAQNLGALVQTINELMEIIQTLQAVLDLTGDFSSVLKLIAKAINEVPVVFFALGNVKNLGDFGGFDEEASSMILVGLKDLKVTLYNDEDFDNGGIDEDHSEFSLDTFFPPVLELVGFRIIPTFAGLNYDTDSGESINDSSESFRFGAAP